MICERMVKRMAPMLVLSVIGWLITWAFEPPADPRISQAQQLIDSGDIYQMTQPELEKQFGSTSSLGLHPTWDADYQLDDEGLMAGQWLVVHLQDSRVVEARIVSN